MVPLGDSYDSSTIEPLIGGLRPEKIDLSD